MQRVLRNLFACLFAVALVFNGGAFRVLANAPAAHPHEIAATGVHSGHQGQYEVSHFAQPDVAVVALDHLPDHDHINGNSKCCTMCVAFDNLMPTPMVTATLFQYRAVIFKIGRQHLVGHWVALDPDIPKTIV